MLLGVFNKLNEIEDCIICLEPMKNTSTKISLTPCSHPFHEQCLWQWLRKSKVCPLCRFEFTIKILEEKFPWVILE